MNRSKQPKGSSLILCVLWVGMLAGIMTFVLAFMSHRVKLMKQSKETLLEIHRAHRSGASTDRSWTFEMQGQDESKSRRRLQRPSQKPAPKRTVRLNF